MPEYEELHKINVQNQVIIVRHLLENMKKERNQDIKISLSKYLDHVTKDFIYECIIYLYDDLNIYIIIIIITLGVVVSPLYY